MEIIKLNLIPSGVNPTCHCSQYDSGRVIRIDLFDGLTPYVLQSGDTVTLNVRKPDNTIVTASVTATQGNTYVNIVTTEQICAVVGYNLCDLTITNGAVVIGTLNFIMQVERDVLADGIPSQSVIEDLDALVEEAVGDNFYNKSETDALLDAKADKSTTYTKTEIDATVETISNKSENDLKVSFDGDVSAWSEIGYIQTSNGQLNASENARNTGLIDCMFISSFELTTKIAPSGLAVAFYDENKTYLNNISIAGTNDTQNIKMTIPSNARYMICSEYAFDNRSLVLIGKIQGEYMQKSEISDYAVLKSDISRYIDENGNQFNKDSVISGKEVYNNGTIVNETDSLISDYINIAGHDYIYLNNLPTYTTGIGRYYAFYNENKEPISYGDTINKNVTQKTINIPSNAVYFVFSIYQRCTETKPSFNMIMLSFYGYLDYSPFKWYIEKIGDDYIPKNSGYSLLTENKKLLVFGDSITETATISDDGSTYTEGTRTNWPTFAKGNLKIGEMRNYAKTGATYKDRQSILYRQQVSDQINMAMADSFNDDTNIVVISLGTNDGDTNIGSYDTAMSKATLADLDRTYLYEAIRWAMWTLRNKYTNAIFFVGVPIQRASNEQPAAMIEAIIKMANRYDFIVINGLTESGIVRDFEVVGGAGRFLEDGLHPNVLGSEKLARLYSNVILQNYIID